MMDRVTGLFLRAREWGRGQTMTEYALILATIALVAIVGYQTFGAGVTNTLAPIDNQL